MSSKGNETRSRNKKVPKRLFNNANLEHAKTLLRKTHVQPPFPPPTTNGVNASFRNPKHHKNLMPPNYVKRAELIAALKNEQMYEMKMRDPRHKEEIGKQDGGATRRKRRSIRGRR